MPKNEIDKLAAIRQLLEKPLDGFGLTKGQAEAIKQIVTGKTVAEIAEMRGVSLQSVYQQMERVQKKTGHDHRTVVGFVYGKLSEILSLEDTNNE